MTESVAPSGAVTLDYAAPPEDLRDYLSVFYEFRADLLHWEATDRADLAQFRVNLAGRGSYHFADGHQQAAPDIQVLGPTTGPTRIVCQGPMHTFGVGLLAGGWGSILDFEASLLTNRVIDATELFGDQLRGLVEALRTTTTIGEKVAIGAALARRLKTRGQSAAFDFTRIVDDWLDSEPSPRVEALVVATGLSRRQVERRCNAYYGSPPKLLARKFRALKAAIALAKGADPASLHGDVFYDQSHFIREIKAFTGTTPARIVDDLPTLAQLTLKRTEFQQTAALVRKT